MLSTGHEHMNTKELNVLVMATTFPRWKDDTVPQFVYELSKELENNQLEIFVLAPHYPGAKRKEKMSGITVYRYPYFVPFRYQKLVLQGEGGVVGAMKQSILAVLQIPLLLISLLIHAIWIIKKENIHVMNSHWLLPNGLIAGFIRSIMGTRHVMTLHARGVLTLRKLPLRSYISKYIYNRSDAILPVSTHIRDEFITMSGIDEPYQDEFYVQPMGAHTNDYDISLKPILKAERNVDDKIVGLFVGRLAEKKGVEYLLKAIKNNHSDNDVFQMIIVGTGHLEKELHDYVKKNDLSERVTFTGYISEEELCEYQILADFVIVPSIETEAGDTEGMPTVIVEAFASGNPVIGTDVGGISDVVKDGENGYVVPQKQPNKLSEKIELLINNADLREDLSTRALEAADELDWQYCGKTYAQVIRSVSSVCTDKRVVE